MMTLEQYRESINEDIDEGAPVEILEEADSFIRVYDETDIFGREYTIFDPASIDDAWISERLIVTPSAKELQYSVDERALAKWIARNVDADMMATLKGIVILGAEDDEDYDYLQGVGDFCYELECSDLPVDEVGLHWFSYGKVFVQLRNIIEDTKGMVEEGILQPWEEEREIGYGVLATVVHEIRHLAQANPYLPQSILMQTSDDESDAESYARNIVDGSFSNVLNANIS